MRRRSRVRIPPEPYEPEVVEGEQFALNNIIFIFVMRCEL